MRWWWLLLLLLLLVGCAGESECVAPPPSEEALGAPTTWEQAWLESDGLPTSPAPHFLDGEEGVPLAYRDWVPEGWDGQGDVVLFVHGSSAHSELYAVLGEGLMRRHVYARLIDVRGHGLSVCRAAGECGAPESAPREIVDDGVYYPGRIGDSHDRHQITRDLSLHLTDLHARFPQARFHLSGHSSGGGAVSRFVEHNGWGLLESVILLSPFNHASQPQNHLQSYECGRIEGSPYAQVHMGALGDALRGNLHRYVLYFNKGEPYVDALDTLSNTWTTTQGMQVDDVDRFHVAFTGPVLWVAAEQDALLDLEASRREFERFPGGGAFVTVRETSHIGLSWSDAVAGLMVDWLSQPEQVESILSP
ncbi:MAG: hypothetical protein CMH57_06385 [Myxococcales bacterium]|nr:hypothetical protein [Myxococcales bacterium]